MKTHLRSILCALLAVCLFISFPIAAEAKTTLFDDWRDEVLGTYGTHYDVDAALQHAKENWDDKNSKGESNGVCDQFVKSCLRAGGIIIGAGDVDPVKDALVDLGIGTEQNLEVSDNGGRVYAEDNPGVQAGDMLNFYCHDCGESVHTVLIAGTIEDSHGHYFYTYGHNPAWNEEIDWIGNFTHTADNGEKHSEFSLNAVKISREKFSCRHSFIYQKNNLNLYENAHPHEMYVECEKCSATYYLGWEATVSTCTTCNPPLADVPIVTATVKNEKILLEWSTVEGAVKYKVERATKKGGDFWELKTDLFVTMTNSSVEKGQTYYYRVTAILANGKTAVSEVVTCRIDDGKPATPEITGKLNDDNQVELSWFAIDDAAEYAIYRCGSYDGKYEKIGKTASTSYIDQSVSSGTYYYKVAAVDAKGVSSDLSDYVCISFTGEKPVVTATAKNGKIYLTWSTVTGAKEYQVERATDKDGSFFVLGKPVSMPQFTNGSVDKDKVYYYRVIAYLEDGTTIVSDPVSCFVSSGKLIAPTVTAYTSMSGKPGLDWSEVPNAISYEIYRASKSSGKYSKIDTTEDTAYVDSSATVGKKFYYKVKAVNADGDKSSYSSAKSAACKCGQAVITATTTASSGKVKLTWEKVEGAKKYSVYRSTKKSSGFKKIGSTTKAYYTDSSASVGKTYYYKLVTLASNDSYNSAYSEVVKGMRICAQPDLVVKRSSSTGKPSLSWDKVSGAKQYKVYRSFTADGDYELIKTTTSTSYKDSSVLPGMTCYYRVDVIGSKSGTNSIPETPIQCQVTCGKPSITVKTDKVSGDPVISWKSVEHAVSYRVLRSTKSSSGFKEVALTMELSFQDETATTGKKYYYKVEALDENGDAGSASSAKSIYSKVGQPEASVALSGKKPKITWAKVDGAKKYEVYRSTKKTSGFKKIKTTSGSSYTDKSAKKGKTYYYKVVAVASSKSANSEYSAVVKIKSK